MSAEPLTSSTLHHFIRRIEGIKPASMRRWGKLSPAGMLAHLDFVIRLSLEETKEPSASTFLSRQVIRRVAFHTPLPWPKGKIKAPPTFTPAAGGIEDERARLVASLKRFVEAAELEPNRTTMHPIFGPFTLRYWQHAHGKHFNHHFEQFGV